MANTKNVGLRLDPAVKEAVKAAAKAECRTIASYLTNVITVDLQAKGFLPAVPDRYGRGDGSGPLTE